MTLVLQSVSPGDRVTDVSSLAPFTTSMRSVVTTRYSSGSWAGSQRLASQPCKLTIVPCYEEFRSGYDPLEERLPTFHFLANSRTAYADGLTSRPRPSSAARNAGTISSSERFPMFKRSTLCLSLASHRTARIKHTSPEPYFVLRTDRMRDQMSGPSQSHLRMLVLRSVAESTDLHRYREGRLSGGLGLAACRYTS